VDDAELDPARPAEHADARVLQSADILQSDLSREMLERFLNWHRWTVNLPGTYYLQVVRELFRDNRLARNSFEALGRVVDLGAVRVPLYRLAGQADEVTPPEQLLETIKLVGTPREQVSTAVAECGHLSLFLGAHTIAREWQRIGQWIRCLNAGGARTVREFEQAA